VVVQVYRPVEPKPRESDPRAAADARTRRYGFGAARMCGQTKTRRAMSGPGWMECLACVYTVRVFDGETNPASTVSTARSEVRFVPRVVALSVLTLFRRRRLLGET